MSRAAGVQWDDPSNLTKREAAKVRANWSEFRDHTTPPGIPFEWGEWPLREDLKHYCLHHGFIEESDAGGWETKEKLWMFLIEDAADDEDVGTRAVGQEQLPVESSGGAASGESRVLADERTPRGGQSSMQSTLTGGDAGDTVNGGKLEANLLKGGSELARAAKAQSDDAQATLTESVESHGDWAGATPRGDTRLTRRSGARVYAGQQPLIVG